MDEILASIRRIIADDQALGYGSGRRSQPQPAVFDENETDPVEEERAAKPLPPEAADEPSYGPERRMPVPRTFAEAADIPPAPRPVLREAQPRPLTAPREPARAPQTPAADRRATAAPVERQPAPVPVERPVQPEAPSAPPERPARSNFSEAAERLLSPRSNATVSSAFEALASSTAPAQAARSPSLEDLVRDMLRPMLKSWLDENLPGLVERLVRQEIERVARSR
jgi:cell pole-organizing protein PopZ